MQPARHRRRPLAALIALLALAAAALAAPLARPATTRAAGSMPASPILFVTHVPTPFDVLTTVTTFGNHLGDVHAAGRGGDLWLRLPDGTLKNLTQAAGLGVTSGFQGAASIAVRDPAVSWDGTRALFSMVVGAPTAPTGSPQPYFWQIYELANLGQIIQSPSTVPQISKLPNQPAYNNITPLYGTNGRIIFTSDTPRQGQAQLFPLLDEYNMRPTNSGLWSLDPASGDLFQIDDSPSGDFSPSIDSFGRVVFVRWDHLERDQQADIDAQRALGGQACLFCTYNYSDESAQAAKLSGNPEVFPEPRPQRSDLLAGTNIAGHHMNEFIPWQINEDGSDAEALNHIGRHELLKHIPAAFTDDPNLVDMNGAPAGAFNQNRVGVFLQLREDPTSPGSFYGTNARELTHGSGQLLRLSGGSPGSNADQMAITYLTHAETYSTTLPLPNSDGHYRDPLPMSDGTLVAAYTTVADFEAPLPNQPAGASKFDFRLYTMGPDAAHPGLLAHSQLLTAGLPAKTLSYYDGNTYIARVNVQLWELQPVEVVARVKPATRGAAALAQPELDAFAQAGVTPQELQDFMAQNNLALIVSRNVTRRDDADRQQPLRLQVGSSGAITAPGGGKLYHIQDLQLFQADQLRGYSGSATVAAAPGRRVLAAPLHDQAALQYNAGVAGAAPGSVTIGQDGSMAAFVPARRAMTWQLTDAGQGPVVRERIWVTSQPGEIRVCAACHGINANDQAGTMGVPVNTPAALIALLQSWKAAEQPAAPTLSQLSPSSKPAGGAGFTLTVSGGNFEGGSVVRWNGLNLATSFVSAGQLSAQVPASLIAGAGSAQVTVFNGGSSTVSGAKAFTITAAPSAQLERVFLPLLAR